METRELFWDIGPLSYTLFYVVAWSAIALFVIGFARHFVKYFRARKSPVPLHLGRGFGRMVVDIFSHRTLVRRDRAAGEAHRPIFYGFAILFIATSIITVDSDITGPAFGSFWNGTFYLAFSLVVDLAGVGLLGGIFFMMWRRFRQRPAKLDYVRAYAGEESLRPQARRWIAEDSLFLWALILIILTGYLQEGVRLVHEQPPWAGWSPVGWLLAEIFSGLGMDPDSAAAVRRANWWVHGVLALTFIAALPWNKAKHMIAVMGSLASRDVNALSRLPRVATETEGDIGISAINQFAWKDLLNFDACTKCGRCHEACPARASGAPLSPRDLILDLRSFAERTQGKVKEGGPQLVGDIIPAETLWSCRSCGACMEICPVGIEHPTMIVQMRRHLVERDEMESQLRDTFGMIADRGNSFGESARQRAAWTETLEFPIKDIREEAADNLWFVGDYASFDPRNQTVSQTVARLFQAAGMDFAILRESERSAGNDVRRAGEEGLFESLVEHNQAAMAAAQPFTRLVTTDPHSYNTIRNEYPDFAETAPINHYSSVLAAMLEDGRLKVTTPLKRRVTLHDPCHLGRLNGNYDEPRRVLELIGCELVEMPRNRDNSFCCGAGGGRIWMPDPPGKEKPAENRMHEAAALGNIDNFIVCCPKDMTMFEDARKTSGHEGDFEVMDLAELVAEAIELKSIDLKQLPPLIDRITEAAAKQVAEIAAERIADVVAEKVMQRLADNPELARQLAAAPQADAPQITAPSTVTEVGGPVTAAELPAYDIPAKEGPRILVAVKHVGELGDEFSIADDGLSIAAEHFEFALNEWDDAALEQALLLQEQIGSGEVVAVTIGPEEAEETLLKVLAKGAHRAVRVWDDSLAATDSVTVARALAGVATREEADLILAGVQSSDLAQGATGTATARILGLPHAAVVLEAEWDGGATLIATRELEGGMRHRFELPAPALLTIQTGGHTPRYATMRMIKQAKKKTIDVLDGASVGLDQAGAQLRALTVPVKSGQAEMLQGDAAEVAKAIADIVRKKRGE
ncbi:MAG: 4Fe-4S dicluster domain-containing protein [Rhodospirillaceae bacterium]|nr:4Fe-4S dicluster domain-containing protein [Rhodospirillaceae bacterium]